MVKRVNTNITVQFLNSFAIPINSPSGYTAVGIIEVAPNYKINLISWSVIWDKVQFSAISGIDSQITESVGFSVLLVKNEILCN